MPNKIFAKLTAHHPAFRSILQQLASRQTGEVIKICEFDRSLVAVTVKAPLPLRCTISIDCKGLLTHLDTWHSSPTEDPSGWTHGICPITTGMPLYALEQQEMFIILSIHGVAPPGADQDHDLIFCRPDAAEVALTPGTHPGWVDFEYDAGPPYSVDLTEYVIQS